MKIFYTFLILFLLLISSVHDAYAIRLPEDTCHKLIDSSKCELQKCSKDCSKEPYGLGICTGTTCICTYYCKQPPQ
ncbi:hypothetical protein ACSBR1_034596 [Camellia fascicularis]